MFIGGGVEAGVLVGIRDKNGPALFGGQSTEAFTLGLNERFQSPLVLGVGEVDA